MLSTQRPSKIHPSIISQCDNLALMKMSSQGDLDELAKVFAGQFGAQDGADRIAAAWEKLTDQIGREQQLKLYRASLGL